MCAYVTRERNDAIHEKQRLRLVSAQHSTRHRKALAVAIQEKRWEWTGSPRFTRNDERVRHPKLVSGSLEALL